MIRLIGLDLDGTLLNSDLMVSPANRAAIEKAKDQGIYVTICTGRMFASALDFARQLDLSHPLITMNGALIKNPVTEEVIAAYPMEEAAVRQAMAILSDHRMTPNFYDEYNLFVGENHPIYDSLKNLMAQDSRYGFKRIGPDFSYEDLLDHHGGDLLKGIFFAEAKVREEVRQKLSPLNLSIVSSSATNLEITHPKASKGQALRTLAKSLGVDLSETMVIGDSENDLSMLMTAGLAVAMDNAPDTIKSACHEITASCEDDGVAKAIEKFALKGSL